MDGRRGLEVGKGMTNMLKIGSSVRPCDSFDVAPTEVHTSCSEDSDMAQYSRTRRKKASDKSQKALQTVGFEVFSQCLTSGVVQSGHALTEVVRMTKSTLSPLWTIERGKNVTPSVDETEGVENVEIGEEENLYLDYELERV